MASSYKFDLFDALKKIDTKDIEWYTRLTEDERKSVPPLILLRWLSGTSSEYQIIALNYFVNPYIFSLSHHKRLLAKLLTIPTSGSSQRYKWLKANQKRSSVGKLSTEVIAEYHKISKRKAEQMYYLFEEQTVIEYAEHLGRQKDEITKIKSEFKKNDE